MIALGRGAAESSGAGRESRLGGWRPASWSPLCDGDAKWPEIGTSPIEDPSSSARTETLTGLRLQRPQGLLSILTETSFTLVMAQRDCFLALSLNNCQEGRQR